MQLLSSFAGGTTLDAVETVCSDKGEMATAGSIHPSEILDTLARLVEKSLVLADKPEGNERRYRLLETIRQYALEKLTESGEGDECKNSPLRYFLQ